MQVMAAPNSYGPSFMSKSIIENAHYYKFNDEDCAYNYTPKAFRWRTRLREIFASVPEMLPLIDDEDVLTSKTYNANSKAVVIYLDQKLCGKEPDYKAIWEELRSIHKEGGIKEGTASVKNFWRHLSVD